MTTLARKVWNQSENDNMVMDRLISRNVYQTYVPVQVDQDLDNERTAYIYEDGSALINTYGNEWRVVPSYGLSSDHEKY